MRPSDIVDRLDQLLPEIQKTGDPVGVLLKYAHDENLSPAQLEKMGQVYNTAKSLTYMDKGASRGGSFSILDTEELVAKYTESPKPKKAHVQVKAAAVDPDLDSLDAWIDKSAACVTNIGERFPDLELLMMSEALKSASVEVPEPAATPHWRNTDRETLVNGRTADMYLQIIDDSREQYFSDLRKLATALQTREISFAEIEDDAIAIHGTDIQPALDTITQYLDNKKIAHVRMTKRASRKMVEDRHGVLPLVVSILKHTERVKTASEILEKEFQPGASPDAKWLRRDGHIPDEDSAGATGDWEKFYGGTRKQDEATAGDSALKASPGGGSPTGDAASDPALKQTSGQGISKDRKDDKVLSYMGADKPKERGDSNNEGDKGWDSLIGNGLQGLGNTFRGGADAARGVHSGVKGIIGELGGANRKQEMIDKGHDETETTAVLQRLLATDDILSQADPQQVVDLANSITAAHPAAARDLPLMRGMLREALQYGSLPQHMHSDLLSQRKTLAEAKEKERQGRDAQYGTGDK